jgi:hypothetical protein
MNPLRNAVESSPDLDGQRQELKRFKERRLPSMATTLAELKELKGEAVASGNQLVAAAAWCVEQIARAQDEYLSAFESARTLKFYACWQELEQVEILLMHLERHYIDESDTFGVRTMRASVERLQSLFPYRMFLSPGMEILEQLCSICEAPIRLRSSCGHKRLELYDGELCGRIITKARANHVALVKNPVQKYSVAFPQDGTRFNYALVDYAVKGLRTPWSSWDYEIEKRVRPSSAMDAERYRGLGRNAPRVCGSKRKFKKCCLEKLEEHYDHYQFEFYEHPAVSIPRLIPNAIVEGIDDMTSPSDNRENDQRTADAERQRTVEANLLSRKIARSGIIIDI